MFQNYSVSPRAGKEVKIISRGLGKQVNTRLPKVQGRAEYVDCDYGEGLDSNVNRVTEESSQINSCVCMYRKVRLVKKQNIHLM